MNLKYVIFVDICKIVTIVYKNIFPETQTKFKYTYSQAKNFPAREHPHNTYAIFRDF